ncbi:MAG TPA: hypothetical protein VK539_26275 [Myxococcaceae bacterium]|nr:hypothetical protein [Myxococcaceae bacterium]
MSLRPRLLFPLVTMLALTSCRQDSKSSPADTGPRLYVQGSSIHLRKWPSTQGESLGQLSIGTECVRLESPQTEWHKVRCGDKEGYISVSLLGEEKPSLEKLKAEAADPQRKLAQRVESALRAATLAPEEDSLRKQLGELFVERNFELLAGAKQPPIGPKFEYPCDSEDGVPHCILENMGFVQQARRRVMTRGQLFLAFVENPEEAAIYRGRFRYAKKSQLVTVEVLERTRFALTPVLERALAHTDWVTTDEDASDTLGPRFGQFALDAPAQNLLGKLPGVWKLLKRSEEGAHGVRINGCTQRAYLLRLFPDLHGRWLAVIDKPGAPFSEERWVSAASKTDSGMKLTLSSSVEDAAPQVFEVRAGGEALASLGEALYTGQTEKYPDHLEPCGSEVAAGPAFSGEFLPAKAMAALYGNFDAGGEHSKWEPSREEQQRLQRLGSAWSQSARPWSWKAYREGEQEKVLLVTTAYEIIGGGIFVKTEDGWRLERANRVISEKMTRFEHADLSVQEIGERGFVAVLEVSGTSSVASGFSEVVLLSDLGGQESINNVGRIQGISGEYLHACPWDEGKAAPGAEEVRCYEYDSEWTFVPDPAQALPQLVVTTRGTQLKEGGGEQVEPVHEIRTFSFRSGEYTLSREQRGP